jgi:hypothetical protein
MGAMSALRLTLEWHRKSCDNLVMATRRGWSRDELLIALRLYMRSPFGKLDGRNPEIISLAEHIRRTPNALAMKACNFASLDPAFRASNRKGLSGASEADREMPNSRVMRSELQRKLRTQWLVLYRRLPPRMIPMSLRCPRERPM